MTGREALLEIVAASGLSRREVSRRMGRAVTYINTVIQRGGGVGVDVLADVARVCGYRLVLEHTETGEKITIDATPPPGE